MQYILNLLHVQIAISLLSLAYCTTTAMAEDLKLISRAIPGKVKAVSFIGSPDTVFVIAGASLLSYARVDSLYRQMSFLDVSSNPLSLVATRGPANESILYVVTQDEFLTIQAQTDTLSLLSTVRIAGPISDAVDPRGMIALQRNRCYISGGSSLSIFDLEDPYHPKLDTLLTTTNFGLNGPILIADTLLFLTRTRPFDTTRVDLYSIASYPPQKLSTANLAATSMYPELPQSLQATGKRVFSTEFNGAMYEVKIDDPSKPTVGRWEFYSVRPFATGNRLYLQERYSPAVTVFDTSTPDTLLPIGQFALSRAMFDVRANATATKYLMITADGLGVQYSDVSDASIPTLIALSPPTGGSFSQVDISGDLLFVSSNAAGFSVYDISNPVRPVFVSQIANRGNGFAILKEQGTFCYLAEGHYSDGGFYAIDATRPESPAITYSKNVGGSVLDFGVYNHAGYLLNSRTNRIVTYDLTDPRNPITVDSIEVPGLPAELITRDQTGYLAFWNITEKDGICVLNLSDPLHPRIRSVLQVEGIHVSSIAFVDQSNIVVLTFGGFLYLINVSNPDSLVITASIQTQYSVRHVKVAGEYAVTGKTLINLRDHLNPKIVAAYTPFINEIAEDVVVKGLYVYALFSTTGLHILQLDTLTTTVKGWRDPRSPVSYSLFQNYPNPFNPSTTISYDLPTRSHVTLRIFNVLGQTVETLVNGNAEAGRHQVQWNPGHLASGVYFYRLQAGNFVENKKMILLR
jgi:hypothetical protein